MCSMVTDAGPETTTGRPIVLDNISKAYGLTQAVDRMHLDISPHQALGIIGPNGAGKSTLMRIIAGETIPDSGRLSVCGHEVDIRHFSPQMAHRLGVRIVHQELALCSNLTVFENFYLEVGAGMGYNWRRRTRALAQEALDQAFPSSGISADVPVESLTLAQRQMVEIARAASAPGMQLLILDEPTSALPHERVAQLRALLDRLRKDGRMVILITHRLGEVLDFADTIVVMRGGAAVWSGSPAGLSRDDLVVRMGGRAAVAMAGRAPREAARQGGEPLLEVRDLSQGILRHVHLHVDPGEIVGVSGLEGSGQRQLLRAVYGGRARRAIRTRGAVALVSGDRRTEGIFPLWSVAHNMSLSTLRRMAHWGVLDRPRERRFVAQWIERLQLRAAGPDAPITSLSGGNQQKAVIARALGTEAPLVLLDDPTRGVDAQTKQEIYELLRQSVARGCGVLWYSTEDQEILVCDRVYIMARGAILDEMERSDISTENLVSVAFDRHEMVGETTAAGGEAARPGGQRVLGWLSKRWMLPLLALVAMMAALGALNAQVYTPMGLDLTVGAAVPLVLAALAQMFVIAVGDIDLGIGSFLGLINVLAVTWLVRNGLLAALAYVGLVLLYPVVGALVHIRRIPAIVVTLGTSFIWLGLGLTILPTSGGQSPDWLQTIYSLDIPVIREPVLITLVSAGAVYWIVTCTGLGVILRGFGNNPAAVEAAGWSTLRIRMSAYLLAGIFALLAGLTVTAVTTSGDASAFSSYTLLGIAAVILGGSEFSGGIVVPVGVVAGALTLSFVSALLSFLSISPNYTAAIEGVILLLLLIGRRLSRGRWAR